LCALALLAFMRTECTGIIGPPQNVKVEAASDSTVKVSWSAPLEGTPDKYIVYFKEVGAASFAILQEITATEYIHSPSGGTTGDYKVTAKFGSETFDGATVTTVPIHTAATDVAELNAAGSSGYGWYRVDGTGSTYSMEQTANAASVDLYVTDWAAGHAGTTYYVVSPDIGASTPDPGGVIDPAAWRANGYNGPVPEQSPLPAHVQGTYIGSLELTQYPEFIAAWTQDNYFALLKVSDFNQSSSTVKVESWFQLVKGLRLIKH
jgi:hypothetical protein